MFRILRRLFGQPNNDTLTGVIKEGAFLVDVRTPGEFAGGSVKGAVNIPPGRSDQSTIEIQEQEKHHHFLQERQSQQPGKKHP